MEILGLSTPPALEDNLFKRLFWPTIQSQYDVDLIGRQGFWLAVIIGSFSFVVVAISGQILIALLVLTAFVLGAAGIRERSVAASSIVLCMYLAGVVGGWILAAMGKAVAGNPLLSIVAIMLLCSNVRATVLSQKWLGSGVDAEFPEAADSGISHFLVNRFPQAVWPKGKYFFFLVGCLYIALTVLGLIAIANRAHLNAVQSHSNAGQIPVANLPIKP